MSLKPIPIRPDIPGDAERYAKDMESFSKNPGVWGHRNEEKEIEQEVLAQITAVLDLTRADLAERLNTLKVSFKKTDTDTQLAKALILSQWGRP